MNSFIIGFSEECSFPEIIETLAENKTITIGEWVTTNARGTIDLFDFYFGKTFNNYDLTHSVPDAILEEVKKNIFEFCYVNSRSFLSHKYINATRSIIYQDMNEFHKFANLIYNIFIQKQISLVLFQEIPHDGAEVILYRLAEAMKINTLILANLPHFWGRTILCYSLDDFGRFDRTPILSDVANDFKFDQNKFQSKMYYMKHVDGYVEKNKNLEDVVKKLGSRLFSKTLLRPFISKEKFLKLQLKFANAILQRDKIAEYQNNIESAIDKNPDLTKKYIYFALHLDPEVPTMAVLAERYYDQVFALEKLSLLAPKDVMIYAKDNPKQTDLFRPTQFFERIRKLKNVRLVHENTNKLIENSCCIATIAGTVGWEAITSGKSMISFGKPWYRGFPGVFQFDEISDIDEVINYKPDIKDIENSVQKLLRKTSEGMIYFDFQNKNYSIKEIYENYNRSENITKLTSSITKMIQNLKSN